MGLKFCYLTRKRVGVWKSSGIKNCKRQRFLFLFSFVGLFASHCLHGAPALGKPWNAPKGNPTWEHVVEQSEKRETGLVVAVSGETQRGPEAPHQSLEGDEASTSFPALKFSESSFTPLEKWRGVSLLKPNILRWYYFLDVKSDFSHGTDPPLSSFEGDRDMSCKHRTFQYSS